MANNMTLILLMECNMGNDKHKTVFSFCMESLPDYHKYPLIILDVVVMLINGCGNVLCVFALVKLKTWKKRPFMLLALLSCGFDFVFGSVTQILAALKLSLSGVPILFDQINEYVVTSFAYWSMFILLLVSVTRYVHARYILGAKHIVTFARIKFALIVIGVFSFTAAVPFFGAHEENACLSVMSGIGIVSVFTTFVINQLSETHAKVQSDGSKKPLQYTIYYARILRHVNRVTIYTLVPLRLPFFGLTIVLGVFPREWLSEEAIDILEVINVYSYIFFCISLGINGIIFIGSTSEVKSYLKLEFSKWFCASGNLFTARKRSNNGTYVQPGWYERIALTSVPQNLSEEIFNDRRETKEEEGVASLQEADYVNPSWFKTLPTIDLPLSEILHSRDRKYSMQQKVQTIKQVDEEEETEDGKSVEKFSPRIQVKAEIHCSFEGKSVAKNNNKQLGNGKKLYENYCYTTYV